MKGYELYSWHGEEEWYFALLQGTNRIKTYEEVTAPEVRLCGLNALKEGLDRLASGETVFWLAERVAGMALPSDALIHEVRTCCEQRDIQLEIVE